MWNDHEQKIKWLAQQIGEKTEYPLKLALVISDTIYFIDRVGKQKQYELNMEISFSI